MENNAFVKRLYNDFNQKPLYRDQTFLLGLKHPCLDWENGLYTVPKEIYFPRYNMKYSGENGILRGIFHVV